MASYYMQRGLGGGGGQPELHASPGMRPMSNPNLPFQPGIGGTMGSSLSVESSGMSPHGVNVGAPPPPGEPVKRKRGRPRKYGPDGSVSLALTPSPSSALPSGGPLTQSQKRGRGRPPGSGKKQQLASLGKISPLDSFMACFCYETI